MLVESFEVVSGGKLEIYRDEDCQNPRDWDNLGTMVFFHRRYKLGDKHSFANPFELRDHLLETEVLSVPVYMYDHSGLALQTTPFSCPWDSGQLGVIYTTKEKVIKEFGNFSDKTQEKVLEVLKKEVETYSAYLEGHCYGFKRLDAEGKELDACWGFIGDDHNQNGLFSHAGVDRKQLKKAD